MFYLMVQNTQNEKLLDKKFNSEKFSSHLFINFDIICSIILHLEEPYV